MIFDYSFFIERSWTKKTWKYQPWYQWAGKSCSFCWHWPSKGKSLSLVSVESYNSRLYRVLFFIALSLTSTTWRRMKPEILKNGLWRNCWWIRWSIQFICLSISFAKYALVKLIVRPWLIFNNNSRRCEDSGKMNGRLKIVLCLSWTSSGRLVPA